MYSQYAFLSLHRDNMGRSSPRTKRYSGKTKSRNDSIVDAECPDALTYVVCDRDIDTIKNIQTGRSGIHLKTKKKIEYFIQWVYGEAGCTLVALRPVAAILYVAVLC